MPAVTCSRFFINFATRLNAIRRDGQFCDVILIVNGQEYSAHRAILAASSNYFQALFTTAMIEKTSQAVKLEIPPTITEELLTFLYTGKAVLCDTNVKGLLIASDYLMVDELKQLCADYFSLSLSPCNCLQIFFLAVKYNCQELIKLAETFVINHFSSLCKNGDFMDLGPVQLRNILCSDDLIVKSERQVYEAVISWINFKIKERVRFFDELFKCIRLSSLSDEFVVKTMTQNLLVTQSNACKLLVNERLSLLCNSSSQSRNCLKIRELGILCVGGRTAGKALKSALVYQPYYDKFLHQCDTLLDKEEHVVVTCEDNLYVIGGLRTPNSIECFQPHLNKWSTVARLSKNSISSAGVCIEGKIFIIGGSDGFQSVSSVQCYDPRSNTVETLPPLPFPRQALAAVGLHGNIYAIGGCTGNTTFNTVDKINPSNDLAWQQAPPMKHHRKYASAEVLRSEKIILVGGYQDTNRTALNSCEVYNPISNDWQEICTVNIPRAAAGIGRIGNRVYVLGGRSDAISTDTIEYYDEDRNTWCIMPTRLPGQCAWLQCGVFSVKQFTHNAGL